MISSKCHSTVLGCIGSLVTIHSNIDSNEIADSLDSKPFIGPKPRLKAPKSFLKGHINKWKWSAFRKDWKSIDIKNSSYFLSLSRRNIERITGILTRHCPLNQHFHHLGLTNSPLCTNSGDVMQWNI